MKGSFIHRHWVTLRAIAIKDIREKRKNRENIAAYYRELEELDKRDGYKDDDDYFDNEERKSNYRNYERNGLGAIL
jgi:hypothetical protein